MSEKNLDPLPERDDDDTTDTSRNSDADYRVGHKHPPLETRFQKGKSGNPKGRPKGRTRHKRNSLKDAFAREAEKLLHLPEGMMLPKIEALTKTIFAQALKGNAAAMKLAVDLLGCPVHGLSEKDVNDRVQQKFRETEELRAAETSKAAREFTNMMLERRAERLNRGIPNLLGL